jgi:hypothetical protein
MNAVEFGKCTMCKVFKVLLFVEERPLCHKCAEEVLTGERTPDPVYH